MPKIGVYNHSYASFRHILPYFCVPETGKYNHGYICLTPASLPTMVKTVKNGIHNNGYICQKLVLLTALGYNSEVNTVNYHLSY